MKTTIDIPESRYKKVKIRAIERGQTLKQIVLASQDRELALSTERVPTPTSPWTNRMLLPEFARLQATGAFRPKPGDRDITELISEDREDCPL